MKHHYVLLAFFLYLVVNLSPLAAQSGCGCNYLQNLSLSAYYGAGRPDFNCHMYVRAYFYGNRSGAWVPGAYDNLGGYSSSAIFNDPNFYEVFDPARAHVVYTFDHSAVVLDGGCLVSKGGFGSTLDKHGLNIHFQGAQLRYFRYSGREFVPGGIDQNCLPQEEEENCPVSCSISGTVNGNTMYTVNQVSSYYNTINVTCSQADRFTFTRSSGSAVYYACSNTPCSSFYVYLNSGQSVTFTIRAYDECDNLITSRNTTLTRGSGGYYRPATGPLAVYPNPGTGLFRVELQDDPGVESLVVRNLLGAEMLRYPAGGGVLRYELDLTALPTGIYRLDVEGAGNRILATDRIVLQR